jgi:recombinational DNA repair protein RecR
VAAALSIGQRLNYINSLTRTLVAAALSIGQRLNYINSLTIKKVMEGLQELQAFLGNF